MDGFQVMLELVLAWHHDVVKLLLRSAPVFTVGQDRQIRSFCKNST